MNSETRNCQNCKKDFTIEPDDFLFYEKIKVPAPTFCYLCRAERRFNFRNEKRLFKAKDAFTNKDIFSLFPEISGRKIITQEEWHGDSWEGMDYGKEYNFSIPFFEQFFQLVSVVPTYNLNTKLLVNSPYSGNAVSLKNCYLCFDSSDLENCMYSNGSNSIKDSLDNSHINHCEKCYESFWLENCYQCYFSIMSSDSNNLWFCKDCLGCSYCFGCVNLRKSSYCIYNQQYSRDAYLKKLDEMKLNYRFGMEQAREKARLFWLSNPVKNIQGTKNYNSSGSYVFNCKNVNDCFLALESEDLRYCQYMNSGNKDCYDVTIWGKKMELNYESCLPGSGTYNVKFSVDCWAGGKNIEYGMYLLSCSDCFGCTGLKKRQYCILNKQYTKEEYFEMVEKIKKQMNAVPYIDKKGNIYRYGEFFPIELSPFGYNNTIAVQHFDMTKEKAEENGYPWYEVPRGKYNITKTKEDLPQKISETTDEVLNEIIECEKCKSAYRILGDELTFYKKENLPLPSLCSDCRFNRRISDRLKIKLYERKCMCGGLSDINGKYNNTSKHTHGNNSCGEVFKTGYSPDRPEVVYCEKCYQNEVY